MRKLDRSNGLYPVLQHFLEEAKLLEARRICPLCQQRCGKSVRECAEDHGGRKEFKAVIRSLDARRNEGGAESDKFNERLAALFDEYQKASIWGCKCHVGLTSSGQSRRYRRIYIPHPLTTPLRHHDGHAIHDLYHHFDYILHLHILRRIPSL